MMSLRSIPRFTNIQKSLRRREVKRFIKAGNQANSRRLWADAETAYSAALAIDPSLPRIWVQYGHALKEQGFLKNAEQAYRRALALDDTEADTYLQLGHALKLQGQRAAAQAAYLESYFRDPASPHSRAELISFGLAIPDAQTVQAFRHQAGGDSADATITVGDRRAVAPHAALGKDFVPDAAFIETLYGTRTIGAVTKRGPGGAVYLSADHLLYVHDIDPGLKDIFDPDFYFFTNQGPSLEIDRPNFAKCLVHFCEVGKDKLLAFNSNYVFNASFYASTYLNSMPFTPSNAYRHWLSQGLREKWSPNREAYVKSCFGRDIQGVDGLDVELCAAITGLAVNATSWKVQFEHFIDGAASDPKVPIIVDESTAVALVAIADRQAIHGKEQQSFALYQRILQHFPSHSHARRHYADGLLRRNCALEARRIYQDLVDHDLEPNIWAFISLSQCNEQLGLFKEALFTLRRAMDVFSGDFGLRHRLRNMARAYFSRVWETAAATGRLGRFEQAQNDISHACTTMSSLIRSTETLPARDIRNVALVVNKDLPQCRFYRIDQKVEQLQLAGYTVAVYDFHEDIPLFLSEIYRFQAVIFYRVPAFFDVIEAIEKARELGLVTFYEIDDLIFDSGAYPDRFESYDNQIQFDEYVGLKLGVPLFAHALSLCDVGLASTTPLAEQMGKRSATGRALVHRNAFGLLHETYASAEPEARPSGRVTVFYGSGTKAHKEDFQELVEPALVELVHRHGDGVAIVLMGYITMTKRLRSIENNITVIEPNWKIENYWAILSQVDINIAVLKPSLMTDCKSEIKWLEAAMFGVPSVVSDTATFREVIETGVTGLICATPAEWTVALNRLVGDATLRRTIGENARRQALSHYGMEAMAANLKQVLRQCSPAPVTPEKPTILIVNVFYPPQAIGGATRVVHDNVRHLAQVYGDCYRIEVFTSIEGGLKPYELSSYACDGVRVTGVATPDEAEIDGKSVDMRMEEVFGRFLDHVAPDVIHFHCIQRLTASIVSAALERRIPYVVSVHDGWWISNSQFLLDAAGSINLYDYSDPMATLHALGQASFDRLMLLRRPLQSALKVLAVSDSFAEIYRNCGVPNVITVANGVSDLPSPERSFSVDGRVRLGFIGGMAKHKGYEFIKYAFYRQQFRNLTLLVIDHSMRAGETRTEVWGSVKVEFRAKISQNRIGLLYGEIDVLLAPSIWPESYGLVTREALHCGCWVVASNRGSIGEYVIEGQNGFIIDVSNPDGLSKVLTTMDQSPEIYIKPPSKRPVIRQAREQADELAEVYGTILSEIKGPTAPSLASSNLA